MKRTILSPAQAAWLAGTIETNRARYAGFKMMADDASGDDSGDGGGDSGDGGAGSGDDKAGGSDASRDFPANTPVANMTPEQQAAYWRTQAQKHEGRNKDLLAITGGKYGDELKNVLDAGEQARRDKLSADERALEDARRTTREEVAREYGPRSVRAAFDLLLGDMPEQDRNAEIDLLDLSKFLTSDGSVDTDKVRRLAAKIAPADKGQGNQQRNYGQGKHGAGQSTGLAAGADMYAAGRKKSTTH